MDFNRLVSEQMKTMDKLLCTQSKLEQLKEVERELFEHNKETELIKVQSEISRLKQELKEIHQQFEQQTEEVIRFYQEKNFIC